MPQEARGPSRWPADKVRKLEQLVARGLNSTEIGERLDKTPKAVRHKMERLGLESKVFWSDAEVERLKVLLSAGYSKKQMSQTLDRSITGVEMKLAQLKKKAKSND